MHIQVPTSVNTMFIFPEDTHIKFVALKEITTQL